jgi:glycosyltransferase involved in cell wall biosynthesis
MDEPAVSIGLPVFNGERFLARAVDSVFAQTYGNWELLISDNGSSDESLAIAQRYAERDPRIRVRAFGDNMGAVANFEAVFRETTGRYFMWLAHDDWIDPRYLERCVGVLETRPDFVMAFAGMNVVDDTGEPFRSRTEEFEGAASKSAVARFHTVLWGLGDPTSPVFGVARRSALKQTGLIRNSNEPDRILVAELSLLGRIHQDPDLLFFHYGPPGHPNRDEWWWLDPRNRGRPRLATFRIVQHQWNAIWRGDHNVFENVVMTMDLLVASLITRTSGKARAIKKQLKLRKS